MGTRKPGCLTLSRPLGETPTTLRRVITKYDRGRARSDARSPPAKANGFQATNPGDSPLTRTRADHRPESWCCSGKTQWECHGFRVPLSRSEEHTSELQSP